MSKMIQVIWLAIFLFMTADPASPHHISMSFYDFQLSEEKATAVLRLPLADAIWMVDPELVVKSDTAIQVKGEQREVDELLKARIKTFLYRSIPEKIHLKGCDYMYDTFAVTFENASIQVRVDLACTPGYMDAPEMTSHFLVDENQLHTSLATLRFPNDVTQCVFKSSQHTCGQEGPGPDPETGPAWQGRIAPFWDYLALGLIILLLAGSGSVAAASLTLAAGAHIIGFLFLRMGLSLPPIEILRAVLSVFPVYAGLAIYTGINRKSGWIWFAMGHGLIFLFACTGFIRLTPFMVMALALAGAGLMASAPGASGQGNRQTRPNASFLYLLGFIFGLIHGLVLAQYRLQYTLPELKDAVSSPLAILICGLVPALLLRRFLTRPRIIHLLAVILTIAGLFIFFARNINLPFSFFDIENAEAMITSLIKGKEITGSLLPILLVAAMVIGGLHALTPGHGKTIVAAYLVGTRGRVRDAFILGIIVTFTHTFSVIILALIALFASRYILADQLVPVLTGVSGLLICALGVYLFQSRLKNFKRAGHGHHDHSHDHHDHSHHHHDPHCGQGHDHHDIHHSGDHQKPARVIRHTHDGVAHSHALPVASNVSVGSLLTLGISGGIVPCPDALAILLLAVSMGRIEFGLLIIIAFSLGLAAILIVIGIAMVKARPLMDRFTGQGRLTTLWMPLISAALVTLLGFIILFRAL